tara:strand:+ start:1402 stop:1857 length:456 start_codon:yes stop_codon:yes gene_type:complete
MFRSVVFAMFLLTASFTGCTDSTPNRTIVNLQIDSDGEDYWIYLYTVPRTKMGNFTISSSLGDDTASLVFSHQKKISLDNMTKDNEDYVTFSFKADLSEVIWEFSCKIRLSADSTEEDIILDAIILNIDEDYDDAPKEWKLPYSAPLNYKQ